jgi:hypothetical protein
MQLLPSDFITGEKSVSKDEFTQKRPLGFGEV